MSVRRFSTLTVLGTGGILLIAVSVAMQYRRKHDVSDVPESEGLYLRATLEAAGAARAFLQWMEGASEQISPDRSVPLAQDARQRHAAPLHGARAALDASPPPHDLAPFATRFADGFAHVEEAFENFASITNAPPAQRIGHVLAAWHHAARAQETFYTLRDALSPFAGYWQLPNTPPVAEVTQRPEGAPTTGVVHVSPGGHHGGFSLYVPESYTAAHSWPLIVALHGGSGNGRDFLWTWVREAKSLQYLLVAPTAVAGTWSEVEDVGLMEIVSWLNQRYRLDNNRILLTGLSDGATFALLYGLAHPDIYRALAPLCGVLHPANEALGNLRRARSVPIYLVHGAQDFLFPVPLARMARDTLVNSGAALEYRELPELSHTYPRSENVRILRWFEGLANVRQPVTQKGD